MQIAHRLLPLMLLQLASSAHSFAADSAAGPPPPEKLSFLDNGRVKVGVDLNRGGAIVYLAKQGGENVVNNFDLGRHIQLSFFSGPVPFSSNGKHPTKHWEHIGWNPVQAGDDFNHGSTLMEHRNSGSELYVKCIPLQWPLDGVPAECTFETWLKLDGGVVQVTARLNNARSDQKQYPARQQELPALYGNAAFHRVVSYTGDAPFTGGPVTEAEKPKGKHPWTFWQATEGWSALVDAKDEGLGLISPGRIAFTGGFAGKPGPNDPKGNSTGYLASLGEEILDHNIRYEFRYELVPGRLQEIRDRAAAVRSQQLPAWEFTKDRQGWKYHHASDAGWPISGALQVALHEKDPQVLSPYCFWKAEDAPYLIIEAAFQTSNTNATVYWQRHGKSAPGGEDVIQFPIQKGEGFHRYVIHLASVPSYQGGMIRLRFDPAGGGTAGEFVKLRSVRLAKSAE